MATVPDVGAGTAIAFSTSFFVAKLTNISWSGIERGAVETTTMTTTGGDTFMPVDTYNSGTLTVDMQFATNVAPPILGAAETITITWPDAETWACSGFMTGYDITAATKEVMTATATIKFSGTITF